MCKYDGFLIDLDGTMYRGKEKIDSAVRFVNKLYKLDYPYLFVTNNSSKTPEQVVKDLTTFGIPAKREQVMTSSLATAHYISQKAMGESVFMIGEEGLEAALKQKGIALVDEQDADSVVIGIDREITYEKLTKACLAIRNGATFISTNADKAIPTEKGFVPGNGALTSVITTSTNTEPTFIGKPEPIMIEQALERLGIEKEKAIMIGDNYATDILAGINARIDTLLVHTGVTTKDDLQHVPTLPTYTLNQLDEWDIKKESVPPNE